MHYYQLHIGDWIKGTSHLTLQEEAIYHRLLMVYYEKERPFPDDMKSISRLIRARGQEELIESILEEFFKKKNKKWFHNRADLELEKFKEKSKKARKSAKARWNNDLTSCERNANAMQTQCEGNANQEPITNNHKPITNNQDISAVAKLPCTKGDEYLITQNDIDVWAEAYPAVDIIQELRKIYSWLHANPNKLKTLKGCPRFVNNWLSKTQDRGGNRERQQSNNQRNDKHEIARQLSDPKYALDNW